MDHREVIDKVELYVKRELEGVEAGHDWWHGYRVRNSAIKLLNTEIGNPFVVEVAALVHDVVDEKFFVPHNALTKLEQFLEHQKLDVAFVDQVLEIITNLSFGKSLERVEEDSPEFCVVHDADRLDAIGAIGIARTFNYGGSRGRELYNPGIPPIDFCTTEDYRKAKSPTINHFYEKLLRLKDLMKTPTGRMMAQKRHDFMVQYLEHFFSEWRGE